MRYFLVGFMGCGKSFWAKQLSLKYKLNSFDLDEYIETQENMSILEIFKNHSENYFRNLESMYLKEIVNRHTNCIVAAGGGTPCNNGTMEWMNEHGTTIYLKSTVDELYNRLKNETSKRPLVSNVEGVLLKDTINKKLNIREHYYNLAEFTINTTNICEDSFKTIFEQYV